MGGGEGGSEIWDPEEGGGEQLYPAKRVYLPCLHVGNFQAPYGSLEGREGDRGSRLPLGVSLEKGGEHHHTPPPRLSRTPSFQAHSWEDQEG